MTPEQKAKRAEKARQYRARNPKWRAYQREYMRKYRIKLKKQYERTKV